MKPPLSTTSYYSDQQPLLSIIIPARYEAERLPRTFHLLENFLEKTLYSAQIIPVVQGNDESVSIVRDLAARDHRVHPLFDPHGKGKGRAVRQGVAAAEGKIILFMDTDLSVPLDSLQRLIEQLLETPSLDILIGSRRHPQSRILIPQTIIRRLLSKIFNLLLKKLELTTLSDTQCGCKLFRYEAAKKVFAQTSIDGFGFDVELLFLANSLHYKIKEAPIDWSNGKNSHFSIFRDGIKTLYDIWMLKKRIKEKIK